MKSRWVCPVCGYVHEGNEAPEKTYVTCCAVGLWAFLEEK